MIREDLMDAVLELSSSVERAGKEIVKAIRQEAELGLGQEVIVATSKGTFRGTIDTVEPPQPIPTDGGLVEFDDAVLRIRITRRVDFAGRHAE